MTDLNELETPLPEGPLAADPSSPEAQPPSTEASETQPSPTSSAASTSTPSPESSAPTGSPLPPDATPSPQSTQQTSSTKSPIRPPLPGPPTIGRTVIVREEHRRDAPGIVVAVHDGGVIDANVFRGDHILHVADALEPIDASELMRGWFYPGLPKAA